MIDDRADLDAAIEVRGSADPVEVAAIVAALGRRAAVVEGASTVDAYARWRQTRLAALNDD